LTHQGLSNNTKNTLKIPIQFSSISTLFNFHQKNGSIIYNFHTIAPNSVKPSWCTLTHQRAFQRYQECGMKGGGLVDHGVQNKTKQTTLLHR
jgi:hypothetical protein